MERYPLISSIYNVSKSWGLKKGRTDAVYKAVSRGGGRLVDIRIPVEIVNRNGTRTTYRSINAVAKNYGITTMEVNTMISKRKVFVRFS